MMIWPVLLANTPSPETIRRKAADVVSRPEYQLDSGLDEAGESLWLTIFAWLLKPFIWLFDVLGDLPLALRILVIVILSIIAVALLVHIGWSLFSAISGRPQKGLHAAADRNQTVDPAELEAAAQRAESAGDHLEAVRLLFRAALIRIERSEEKKLRVGITNRELLRRYRNSPLGDPLQLFVETIDRKWYGREICEQGDYAQCSEGHGRIQALTQRGVDALGA